MKKRIIYPIILVIYISLVLLLVFHERAVEGSSIHSFWDGIWYLLVTVSTIGYGDYYPISPVGKIIGVVFVFSSIAVMGYLISRLTIKLNQYMEDKKAGLHGTKMQNHIVIIGYDRFSSHIIKQIVPTGRKVAVVTNKKDDLDLIKSTFSSNDVFCLFTDFDNFEHLEKVNIRQSSKVLVQFDNDTDMLVYVLHLKSHFNCLNLVVSLDNPSLKKPFLSAGVLHAVSKDEIAARLVASYIFEPEVAELTEDIMSSATSQFDFDIMEFKVVEGNPYLGKDYHHIFHDLKDRFNGILLGVYKDEELYKNPTAKIIISENDYMVLIGNSETKAFIEKEFKVLQGRF
jgi:voltage-gated potassium channel